jgi:glycerophosphoryl diester phosphodiesterase
VGAETPSTTFPRGHEHAARIDHDDVPAFGGVVLQHLSRRDGSYLRIGHRGAALLAPENTVRSFRAAAELGVDLIEFDVLDLPRGPLVVAHSDHLDEVSHGVAGGRVRDHTLEELRRVAPELPTLDEALAFFVEEAPSTGLHVDLKLRTRLDELVAALARHGLEQRTVVSSFHTPSLRAVARQAPGIRIGLTYPEDRFSISRRPALWPVVALGLSAMRASVPYRLGRMVRAAGAGALMLQHRSHEHGIPVLAWTVDEPADLDRVVRAGVDGVITNDPRIFVAILET